MNRVADCYTHLLLFTISHVVTRFWWLICSRETLELESQLDAAAMRSRRAGVTQSDTHATTTQLHALELHNSNLQVCLL